MNVHTPYENGLRHWMTPIKYRTLLIVTTGHLSQDTQVLLTRKSSQGALHPVILAVTKGRQTNLVKSFFQAKAYHSWQRHTVLDEMSIRTLPTNPLQIVFKIVLNSKVIAKSIIDPDDKF